MLVSPVTVVPYTKFYQFQLSPVKLGEEACPQPEGQESSYTSSLAPIQLHKQPLSHTHIVAPEPASTALPTTVAPHAPAQHSQGPPRQLLPGGTPGPAGINRTNKATKSELELCKQESVTRISIL